MARLLASGRLIRSAEMIRSAVAFTPRRRNLRSYETLPRERRPRLSRPPRGTRWRHWQAALQWLRFMPWLSYREAARISGAGEGALKAAAAIRPEVANELKAMGLRFRYEHVPRCRKCGAAILS